MGRCDSLRRYLSKDAFRKPIHTHLAAGQAFQVLLRQAFTFRQDFLTSVVLDGSRKNVEAGEGARLPGGKLLMHHGDDAFGNAGRRIDGW